MFSLLKINNLYNLVTAFYAGSFYFYYSKTIESFSYYNLTFAFFGTLLSYEYLQIKKINLILGLICSILFFYINHPLYYFLALILTLLYDQLLRKIMLLKPLTISVSWLLLLDISKLNTLLIFEIILLTLALAIPFDIRDLNEDKIKTLVKQIGVLKTKASLILIWGLFLYFKIMNDLSLKDAFLVSLLSLYYLLILIKIKPGNSRRLTNVYLDGIYFFQIFFLIFQ